MLMPHELPLLSLAYDRVWLADTRIAVTDARHMVGVLLDGIEQGGGTDGDQQLAAHLADALDSLTRAAVLLAAAVVGIDAYPDDPDPLPPGINLADPDPQEKT